MITPPALGTAPQDAPLPATGESTTLRYSVVICTLERRDDLSRCVASWLRQDPLPLEIVVVHGGPSEDLEQHLHAAIDGSGVALTYLRMPPSLVRQRNAGLQLARGDVVFFADDDAEYLDGYAATILAVYESDVGGAIGGVQGTIMNPPAVTATRSRLAKVFLLTRLNGNGTLQASGWPAFSPPRPALVPVEVFSGSAMSFRREVLAEFQFDELLATYYVGDDFELAYRVSRKCRLFQVPEAQLMHYTTPPQGSAGARRRARMNVVNHHYLNRKLLGDSWKTRLAWAWSEFGTCLLTMSWLLAGRGSGRFVGTIEGYWDVLRRRGPADVRGDPLLPDGRSK